MTQRKISRTFFVCLIFASLFFSGQVIAQNQQTSDTLSLVVEEPLKIHSPKKATILSAVLPGAGQIYNKKYWKAPIAWGGLAVCVYFIDDNTKNYRLYKEAYIAELDDDPSTNNETGFNFETVEARMEQSRRWLDLSYISLAAVYALQIIDANVDAHLFYFDVNEDLSVSWAPYSVTNVGLNPGIGLTINF